jgi:hypothetical protein
MKRFTLLLLAVFLFAGAFATADEGMWLYNAVPKDKIKAKYGFEITQPWLDHLRLSSVRLGASASFVSPDGLIFTNHHVGAGCVHDVSTKDHDYMKNGFYAESRAQEPKCPGMEASVLVNIEDVTAKVNANVKPEMKPAEVLQAQRMATAAIEKECSVASYRCDVVSLYAGALYHLYKYRRYSDLRLVFAPEYDVAFFGGDPDNFTYPRFDLDITFLRAYENDKPVHVDNYLKWSKTGVKEGDLVFVSGNPGSTGRLTTYAQMEYLRDVQYPRSLKSMERRIKLLQGFAAQSPENARIVERMIFGLQNSYKATVGYNSGLLDKSFMAKKQAEEKKLRDAVTTDPKLKAEFGDPWGELEQAIGVQREIGLRASFVDGTFNSTLLNMARTVVRAADEKQKPNAARLREFRDSALPMTERRLFSPVPVYKSLDVLQLTDAVNDMVSTLGPNDAFVVKLLAGKTPEAFAQSVVDGTKLDQVAVRKQLYEGGKTAIDASTDPAIVLMKALDPDARAIRKQVEDQVTSVEQRSGTQIAKIMFAKRGFTEPPDATGTLRLSYGVVKGYVEDGRKVPYFTTFNGAFQHAARNENKPPYFLPETWMAFNPGDKKDGKIVNAGLKAGKLKLETPLNFVSTPDIIGGNSGSPVVNKQGEIVGIIFDGNIQSLPMRFMYEDVVGRAVSVDSRGILEALRDIYDATPLVEELVGRQAIETEKPATLKQKK